MSDVIRHATVIVDLVQGKAELKAPDMGPVINARQKELELINQIEAGQRRLIDLQNQLLNPPGGAAPGAPGGGGGGSPAIPAPEAVDEAAEAQQRLAAALRETGEGVLRLSRGFVLLSGASDETLETMVKSLAVVQGLHDLYSGSEKIVRNLAEAEKALAAAQALQTAATVGGTAAAGAATAATASYTTATLALAAAQRAATVVLNPVTLAIAALAAVVMTAVEAYDYFTTSADEAREAVLAQAQAVDILTAAFDKQLAIERQITDLQRTTMSDAEKRASLDKQYFQGIGDASFDIDMARGKSPEAEKVARESAARQYAEAAAALKQRDQLERNILDNQKQQADNQIEAIKRQEQLVEAAQRQVDAEKQKADAMQSQIGRLSTLQQSQLKALRDKLLAGGDLSRGEEKRLDELGGEQGRAIVDARARKRAEAAGFGPDFFKGIEGASTGMDSAAQKLKEAAEALKALTSGATAAAKIAEIEAEKQKLEKGMTEFRKALQDQIDATAKLMQENATRLHELEITVRVNAAAG